MIAAGERQQSLNGVRFVAGDPGSVTIDPNGNLSQKVEGTTTLTYEWNAENQLMRVLQNGTEVARYAYDPLGRRVEKVAGSTTTTWAYDGEDILREVAGSSTLKYVHGPRIDEPLTYEDGAGALTFLHADGLGSVVRTTNSAGAVVASRRYDAFGNLEVGATNGHAFTAREFDAETGLYYYRARYYDPKVGRFLSEDPSRIWSWPNFYAYVENNPVDYTDPMGLMKVKQGVAVPTGPLLINLRCIEECIGTPFEIRVTETTGSHPPKDPHTRGVAADFTIVTRDPFLNPRLPTAMPPGITKNQVLCCARACSFNFSQWEVAPPHFHVQIPPGRGGAIRPPLSTCCP